MSASGHRCPLAANIAWRAQVVLRRPDTDAVLLRQLPLQRRKILGLVGLSRHSAISAARTISTARTSSVIAQASALALGSGLIGIAVALLVEARLGLAPYDVLASGLSERIDLSLGQSGWLLAAILFVAAAMLGRPPSMWGVGYMVLNGLAIDAASGLLQTPTSLIVRALFVPAGVVVMAAGINVVVHSGTTGGPFELLMAAGEDRGVSRLTVRYGLDIGVFASGVLIGGAFGPATLFYGAFMGIAIVVVSEAFEDHRRGRAIRSLDSNPSLVGPAGATGATSVHHQPDLLTIDHFLISNDTTRPSRDR